MRDETLIQLYLIYEILMEEPAGYSTRVTGQRKLVRLIGIRRWSLFCFFFGFAGIFLTEHVRLPSPRRLVSQGRHAKGNGSPRASAENWVDLRRTG